MKRVLLVAFLLPCSLSLFGTHNRAGEITYTHIDSINGQPNFAPSYLFTVSTYTEIASSANRDSLELIVRYCVDSSIVDQFWVYISNGPMGVDVGNGIRWNVYTHKPGDMYTFPGPGSYSVGMLDPNRIDGITNIPGSVTIPFYLENKIIIKPPLFFGFNNSPILFAPPIDYASCCQPFTHNPAAYDPDGDSLVFSLIVPLQDLNNEVPGYTYPDDPIHQICPPNDLQINTATGELTWASVQKQGIYNIAILIEEYRDGVFCGDMIRDMQIIVLCNENSPPVLSEIRDTCIVAGELLTLNISATDADIVVGQEVTLSATGGPFFVTPSPATFVSNSPANPVNGTFSWQTVCDHIRPQFYTVVFKAEDDFVGPSGDPQPYVDVKTWVIRVVAPPPTGLTATANGNQIDLAWDSPYQCENTYKFRGFSVWRKAGCDSLLLDTCFAGTPALLGYTNISGNDPIPGFTYTDANVVRGIIYSYRVVAEFADTALAGPPFYYNRVSGLPSNEACIELLKDVPIITHVDVVVTDQNAGVVDIAWTKPFPDELDTIQNPGPYKYELYQGQGFTGASNLIQTFTSNTFAGLTDTSFTDTGLNTQDNPNNYIIRFFATDNQSQFYEIGASENASSVFLTLASGGNLTLNWQEQVPWENFEYIVLKETPTGSNNFVELDTVTEQTYTDFAVTIGQTYCYKILALGSYFNPAIEPDTLRNHSQIACAVAIDTIPPCAPDLTVTNACEGGSVNLKPEDIKNVLTWNNPNNSCASDVAAYNVYFRPTLEGAFSLLATIGSATDTTYVHENLTSLAGCYAVTALDSFGNESMLSNVVCVENCPLYQLPNVFTPNGDGANELFIPFPYQFVDRIDIKIFTRWGNLVFETTDPDINWNGTDQATGKQLKEGVYYYVCDVFEQRLEGVRQIDEPLSGYIHIIR